MFTGPEMSGPATGKLELPLGEFSPLHLSFFRPVDLTIAVITCIFICWKVSYLSWSVACCMHFSLYILQCVLNFLSLEVCLIVQSALLKTNANIDRWSVRTPVPLHSLVSAFFAIFSKPVPASTDLSEVRKRFQWNILKERRILHDWFLNGIHTVKKNTKFKSFLFYF